jgi:hypothetical protein
MGAWGPALFSDDDACDVRDEYRALIEDQVDDEEATRRILDAFAETLTDSTTAATVWIALAVTQSKIGRLDNRVAAMAVAAIDSEEALEGWDDPKLRAQRKSNLAKARDQLLGPQPARKRLRRPKREETDLHQGDVLAYWVDGRPVLLRVKRLNERRTFVLPVMRLLDYDGTDLPTVEVMDGLPDRSPLGLLGPNVFGHSATKRRDEYLDAGFEIVGRISARDGDDNPDDHGGLGGVWASLASAIEREVRLDAIQHPPEG